VIIYTLENIVSFLNIYNNIGMENNNNNRKSIVPIVSYFNLDANKNIIYEENKGKSGIYR
jgi:hypothetical protein